VTLTETLPESALLPEMGPFSQGLVQLVLGSALVLGLVATIWASRRNRVLVFGLATAAIWIVLYSASPVAISDNNTGGYVVYRHFTSVLPLIFLLGLHGASRGPKALRAIGVLLVGTSLCAGVATE
jgi:hypothetical protein